MIFKKSLIALSLTALVAGCSLIENPSISHEQLVVTNSTTNLDQQQVGQIVDEYFNESMKLNPISGTFNGRQEFNDQFRAPISDKSRAKSLAFEQKYLAKINQIDVNQLSGQALLSYELFKLDREMAVQGSHFP
ncbi:MAG: DUF885 domain-containing protein, partial [Psychrosphaera sp.]|nr:DUF885 domain-containing protein [Psychrosphaera sp.]